MSASKFYYVISETYDGYYRVVAKTKTEQQAWRVANIYREHDKNHMYFAEDGNTVVDGLTHGVLPLIDLDAMPISQ